MSLDVNKWDGVDRRAHLEDVDPIMLERRLGKIDTDVAVVKAQIQHITECVEDIKSYMAEDRKPKSKWTEWATVALSVLATAGIGIAAYVSPVKDAVASLKAMDTRQWDVINEIKETVDKREGTIQSYIDHLDRYHDTKLLSTKKSGD